MSHRTERDLSSKRERIINVFEVYASPCILTLSLSFVLSDFNINLNRIKLKTCISNKGLALNRKSVLIYKVRQTQKLLYIYSLTTHTQIVGNN